MPRRPDHLGDRKIDVAAPFAGERVEARAAPDRRRRTVETFAVERGQAPPFQRTLRRIMDDIRREGRGEGQDRTDYAPQR